MKTIDILISGWKRDLPKCAHCIQSIATDKNDLYCTAKGQLVERNDQCEEWERATGSDDE